MAVSNSNIIKIAEKVKTYVEKNKKLPANVTLDNKKYSYATCVYLFAKFIQNTKSSVNLINIKNAEKASGDTINEKIYAEDYKYMATNLVAYIEKNKQLPNYITTKKSKKKARVKLYTYAFAKIVVYYGKHKQLPKYCEFQSNAFKTQTSQTKQVTTIKKYGRSIKTGCDNRGQNTGYFCACHMAQEIVRNLTGVVIPQSTIAKIMGTTSAGTGHPGIDTFFAWFNRNYKYELVWEWKNFSDIGWTGIKKILASNNQDCGLHELYRRQYGHYTNFDKIYENSIDVHNSLGSKCSGSCYCGYTENRTKAEARSYLNGISQKSVIIVTRKK